MDLALVGRFQIRVVIIATADQKVAGESKFTHD